MFVTRVEVILFDRSPGASALVIPQSEVVSHVLASPDRMSKELRKWLWNLINAAFGVLVRMTGGKPVVSSTTPPVMMLVESSSSSSSTGGV